MLTQLKQLAGERSSERRAELLHKLTDLYLVQGDEPSAAEAFLFSEIMERILSEVVPEQKAEIAERVAPSERTPLGLARALAGDADIRVARPVLAHSPVLEEGDILSIAATAGDAHLNAIAGRTTLSSSVTDVLIDRGSREVLRTVSGNHGAAISQRGMMNLAGRTREDETLGALLADRPDMTQERVDGLRELVSSSLAMRLAERGLDVGEALAPELVAEAQARFRAELQRRRTEMRDTRELQAQIDAGKMSLDAALRGVTAAGRLIDAATLLAHALKLERNFVFQMIVTGEVLTTALVFKALGLSYGTLTDVLALRARKRQEPAGRSLVTAEDYIAMDAAAAQRTVRFLKVRMTVKS